MKLSADNLQRTWKSALALTEEYLREPRKADQILSDYSSAHEQHRNGRLKALFYSMLRYKKLSESVIKKFTTRPPTTQVEAILLLALGEICSEQPERMPKIIHMVVEVSKSLTHAREVSFLNAVLRKAGHEVVRIQQETETPLHLRYSHPQWLVDRWQQTWNPSIVEKLLQWNQSVARLYLRLSTGTNLEEYPFLENLPHTPYPSYRFVPSESFEKILPLLQRGQGYIQDPSTTVGLQEFPLHPDATVLDLCAAPGGKSRFWLEQLNEKGCLVAADLPTRCEPLRENLQAFPHAVITPCDILTVAPTEIHANIHTFDVVNLDAPCSNTGVMQRRPDVKERLTPKSLQEVISLQKKLLHKATTWVKEGGFLIYSTCSIEPAENALQIEGFLQDHPDFTLQRTYISLPWEQQHDGGGTFWLQKNKS